MGHSSFRIVSEFLTIATMPPTDETWTIKRLLEWTAPFFARKKVDSPRLCAELLLSHVLKLPRIALYTNYERIATAEELAAYRELVRRAGEQEPVAYLTGKAHFFNLELEITPDVLIPRPDTEVLVENAIRLARQSPKLESPRILDLCTGSGCIAAAIASNLKTATVIATDIDPKAAAIARRNIEKLGLSSRISVLEGDLFAPLENLPDCQPFHFILANPPYIRTDQIARLDRNVRDFEPTAALDGGADGLTIHRRILTSAEKWLVPGGYVLLEIAFDQGAAAMEAMAARAFLVDAKVCKDYAGRDRVAAVKRKD
jgi:release factor glutamine methyltransferase